MKPRLVKAAGRLAGIMGRLAIGDGLGPTGSHFRKLVQESLALFKRGSEVKQSDERFPGLVVSVIIDGFKRLLERLQERARGFGRLDRSNRLEPLIPCAFEALDFEILNLLVRKRNQLIPNEMHDPGCLGFLVGLKW